MPVLLQWLAKFLGHDSLQDGYKNLKGVRFHFYFCSLIVFWVFLQGFSYILPLFVARIQREDGQGYLSYNDTVGITENYQYIQTLLVHIQYI